MKSWFFDEQNNALRWHESYSSVDSVIYIHRLGCASSSDYPMVLTSNNYLECHSLLVDLPDAGFSDKPTTASYDSASQLIVLQKWFTEIIKLSNVCLYSHSAGAFIALKLAAKIPSPPLRIILCTPGLTDYGVLLLEEITSVSESKFIVHGFDHLMSRLKNDAENAKWLGPFQGASPKAIYQWAVSALNDNNEDWISALAELPLSKGVILPDTATLDEIERYI